MNAERLLALYERLAEAPDAIARLRRFILDLAVRGKLVPQDVNDEPASILYSALSGTFVTPARTAGRGLRTAIAKGLIDEPPFSPASGWQWVRMGELGETNIGLTYSPNDLSNNGIPVLRSNNVRDGRIVLDDLVRVVQMPKVSVMANKGDMLICARNGSRTLVGKAAIIPDLSEPMAFGAFMAIFRSPINPYLHLFLTSPIFREVIDEVNTNTINQITQANLRSTLVPLPPLAEQHRIVAKVDELMALCDRLEAARKDREAKRDRLSAASLARLNTPDPETFTADARFTLEALPALTTRPNQIKQLRQTILNLAVRGKLVPQDANDEPASNVGLRIKSRTRGQIQEAIEPPFKLPVGWAWRAIDTLADQVTDGEHATPPRISETQIPLVTAKNVREGFMDYSQTDWVSFETAQKAWGRCRPQVGDLLLVCVGATTGRLTVLREPRDMVLVRSVALIRPNSHVLTEYLERAIRSPLVQEQIWASVKAAAQPCLYINRIQSLLVPLPPLAEQHRIVAKVDELMALCDRLEASLTTSDQTRIRLLEATLTEALSPASISEMEAAE